MTETRAAVYAIGDLAREFDITPRAIRFYEDQGLLRPARQGQTRVYSSRDRVRLMLILRGKRLGFSIQEIGEMLALYDAPDGETAQIQFLLERIESRRALLAEQARDIELTLRELDELEARCRRTLRTT